MHIAYITAGAAGMYCGSCMRDNTLVTALHQIGHEAILVPTYTPIRTDEEDVSQRRVFFGGINVYLQQKSWLFRHTPWLLDRLLDVPRLLRWVSRFAMKTQAQDLADLTLSMLKGKDGFQRKEIDKLVTWLAQDAKPQIVNLTNALLAGMVGELKRRHPVPVLCSLQGDDIFLESLPEPARSQALDLVAGLCRDVDGFIATSHFYADFMSGYFKVPRERIHVVHPGLNLKGHGGSRPKRGSRPFTVGYFARIAPEKGFHALAEAWLLLRKQPGAPHVRLRVSGWLGENHRAYFEGIHRKIADAGLLEDFEHVEAPDHAAKVRFLHSVDVLSVPAPYREPKGLYVLEALANGVPVVQPRHGSYPELIEATGGGLLFEPGDPHGLAAALRRLAEDPAEGVELGRRGRDVVHRHFHAERMARETVAIYQKYLS
jgi:glycosyltransferase involved in cell wall biosynthesis